MALLKVYCDDSGTDQKSRVVVVAGYLSTVAQWDIFSKEWSKALKEFGLTHLRRADLENFQGQFKKWTPTRRTELVQRLQRIIKRRTKFPLANVVIKDDFERVIPDDLKQKMGGVYGFLAYLCLVGVGQWCRKSSRQHTQPIHWVFEAGTEGSHQVGQMLQATYANESLRQQSRLGGWSFQDKDTIPLQSADLLAYECFKLILNQTVETNPARPIRQSVRHLLGTDQCPYMKFWEEPWLTKFVNEWRQRSDVSSASPSFGDDNRSA